ncbi:MAG: hypothetical protein R3C02_00645 [Planctomycetaceae bacterium]
MHNTDPRSAERRVGRTINIVSDNPEIPEVVEVLVVGIAISVCADSHDLSVILNLDVMEVDRDDIAPVVTETRVQGTIRLESDNHTVGVAPVACDNNPILIIDCHGLAVFLSPKVEDHNAAVAKRRIQTPILIVSRDNDIFSEAVILISLSLTDSDDLAVGLDGHIISVCFFRIGKIGDDNSLSAETEVKRAGSEERSLLQFFKGEAGAVQVGLSASTDGPDPGTGERLEGE